MNLSIRSYLNNLRLFINNMKNYRLTNQSNSFHLFKCFLFYFNLKLLLNILLVATVIHRVDCAYVIDFKLN